MKSIFSPSDTAELLGRINRLTPQTRPLWGKMSVDQMLAHVNVSYEMVYTDIHPKPGAFMKFVVKLLVKNKVVGPAPYKKNGPTAPQFVIKSYKDFETEKQRLVQYLQKTQELGESYFDGRESHSFGKLSKEEWNTMFYKHLDHHLGQFGV